MRHPVPSHSFRLAMVSAAVSLAVSHIALASSHREAPGITAMPKVDATDFYAFNSYEDGRDDYVTLIANYQPLQDAYGGPNYFAMDTAALYEIHVDNTGDAVEDLTFRFQFDKALGGMGGVELPIGDEMVAIPLKAFGQIPGDNDGGSANFFETYSLSVVSGDRRSGTADAVTDMMGGASSFAKPLDYAGNKTFPDYDSYVTGLSNSGMAYNDVTLSSCPEGAQDARVFVGQRKDSFAINLGGIFDLVNLNPLAEEQTPDNDDLVDKNVTTLAVEVHKDCLTGGGDNTVIGTWTTASKRQVSVLDPEPTFDNNSVEAGAWTQVSRLGAPLVNEVVIGLPDKDAFNASEPSGDGQFAAYVTNPTLPALLDVLFGDGFPDVDNIAPSNLPRTDLVAAFLTGFPGVNQLPAQGEGDTAAVMAAEMLRLNTAVPATGMGDQAELGVAAGDLAGFPNGRRPGDDIVDIALRVVMGALCHPIGVDLDESGTGGDDGDNLGICEESDAPAGSLAFTDGVPQNAAQFDASFPYLTSPVPGATADQ